MRHELQPRQASRYARIAALVAAIGVGLWTQLGRGVAQPAAGHPSLRKIAELDLPGPPGKRFDYLTIDDDDNYLLSAHLGAGLLHVINLATNAVVKTVRDVPGVEGVAYVAEGRKVYTANWGENKIGVVDLARMSVIKRLPTEDKPDGIAYAAPFHKAYVSNERAKAESVIDVKTDTIVKVLRFDSETGVPQYDPIARKIYVNLQDQNILAWRSTPSTIARSFPARATTHSRCSTSTRVGRSPTCRWPRAQTS